jgi:hypothetical protein
MEKDAEVYDRTRKWCFELKQHRPRVDVVEAIRSRLKESVQPTERIALLQELAAEFEAVGKNPEARQILMEVIELEHGSALSFASLASHFLYSESDPDKAFEAILRAEESAKRSGHFRRHVQAQKARISLALNRYDLLGECLRQIPLIVLEPGQRDVRRERDFFDRADKSKIRPDIVKAFQLYLQEAT